MRSGGAVLTSFADSVRPAEWTFPVRNRWIAGLADVVIVVEAGERSGALWTARHAASMHRDVVVVAQDGHLSGGCRALSDRGAPVVNDLWRWCATRGVGVGLEPCAWLRDVLVGTTVEAASQRHRVAISVLCETLGELCALGEVEALPHGRYGPKGRLAHIVP